MESLIIVCRIKLDQTLPYAQTHSKKQEGPIRVDFEKAEQGPETAAKLSKEADYQMFNEQELFLLVRKPAATA